MKTVTGIVLLHRLRDDVRSEQVWKLQTAVPCRGHGPNMRCGNNEEDSMKTSSWEVQSVQSNSLLACACLSESAVLTE